MYLEAYPQTSGGYTLTVASVAGRFLYEAERLYGPRDREYLLAGVEWISDGPRVWYPKYGDGFKAIIIQLGANSRQDWSLLQWQLAHEVIHVLSPSGGNHGTYLEEGLATHFQDSWAASHNVSSEWARQNREVGFHNGQHGNYIVARDAVRRLLALNPDAIRVLRKKEPSLYKIGAEHIAAAFPALPTEEVCLLARKFDGRSPVKR